MNFIPAVLMFFIQDAFLLYRRKKKHKLLKMKEIRTILINRKKFKYCGFALFALLSLSACGNSSDVEKSAGNEQAHDNEQLISPTKEVTELEDGLSTVSFEGDYGFDTFLENGGASSDSAVVDFLSSELLGQVSGLAFTSNGFGCSTLSVKNNEGQQLFGRNFDWQKSNAQIVKVSPENGYRSISTVNLDFLDGYDNYLKLIPGEAKNIPVIYAPMDGMNEEGLTAAVLVIEDSDVINQTTEKPDLTTTTAIRLLLDKAATVDEAIALLEQYDMNSSMGLMVHFSLSDPSGKSVVVEYVDNQMIVTETPVVTNFYLAEGEKNGLGSQQSHERFEILSRQLEATPVMDEEQVKNALDSVSKDDFGEFESTEWSIVYNQTAGQVHYYHRENYDKRFIFELEK